MRKSKALLKSAAESFVGEMKKRFPGIDAEIIYESVDGFDVYVRLGLPPETEDALIEVLDASSEIRWRLQDETGVAITAPPVKLEALSHG